MRLLAIYGSPRAGGNSDLLLSSFVEGAKRVGFSIKEVYVRDLKIMPCNGCGQCSQKEFCPLEDDMQWVYKEIEGADVLVVATPVYFYNVPAPLKALVDRSQLLWHKGLRSEKPGYLLSVGGSKGQRLFEGVVLTVKYFFEACGFYLKQQFFYKQIDSFGEIKRHPEALKEVYRAGLNLCQK